jgi:nicotinamide phosphoribosyltransferase
MNPLLKVDFYKPHHFFMYVIGMTKLYSNLTPRKSRIAGVNEVVVVGIQHFIQEYLIKDFNKNFFKKNIDYIISEYKRHVQLPSYDHVVALHKLGYLPIEIKALDEGTLCPIGVPMLTITNTHPDFGWLVNYLETLISCSLWQPITSATIAYEYKKVLEKYALETTGSTEGVQWQGHDFSMRGMSSVESAVLSGMGHLLSFTGTDTIPAIYQLEQSYKAKGLIGASVPATEHSIECMNAMGTMEGEYEHTLRLLKLYPSGIISKVSDTTDLWSYITKVLPKCISEIMSRDGKLVIRPDSGDPVDIICGLPIEKFDTLEDAIEDFEDTLSSNQVHGEPEFTCDEEITVQVDDKYYILKADNVDWNRYDKQYYFVEDYNISSEEVADKPCNKGVIELLWGIFGGTVNEQGYKVLDPHIGAIYGDSITLVRAKEICERLKTKGFASTNWVAGIGSMTYTGGETTENQQYWVTRDLFGFAMKATYGEITHYDESWYLKTGQKQTTFVEAREIFKDPITDDGTKKSKKGLLCVDRLLSTNPFNLELEEKIVVYDQCPWTGDEITASEDKGLLTTVFKDGVLVKETTLDQIRKKLNKQ